MRLHCFWVWLEVDLLKLEQAGLDLLQIPLSLEVIRQLELKLHCGCSFLFLLLLHHRQQPDCLFCLFFLAFGEVAEVGGVPVYFVHDVCAVADELEVDVHQFLLVLLGQLLAVHQLGLLQVLLPHLLCVHVLRPQLVVLLLCRNVPLLALLTLLTPHCDRVLVGD